MFDRKGQILVAAEDGVSEEELMDAALEAGAEDTSGCVSFMFDRKGQILVAAEDGVSEEELMDAALEAGAEDFIVEEDGFEVITEPNDFAAVRDALKEAGYEFISADVKMIPQTTTELTEDGQRNAMEKLIDMLEDDDDVQDIYHNWEIIE